MRKKLGKQWEVEVMFEESLELIMKPVNFSFGVILFCAIIMVWLSLDNNNAK